jgi:hypothetical protein
VPRRSGLRSFDPRRVGSLEARAWETYYRHRWVEFLAAAVGLVRATFGLSWPDTMRGAWFVLRANQKWSPVPDNDPAAARALMRRFYVLLREQAPELDPVHAAELEVEWWRAHREHQHAPGSTSSELVAALTALYAYSYGAEPEAVRPAAALRADAMEVSDCWVDAGCDPTDPRLAEERALLVRSYAALLAAVHR